VKDHKIIGSLYKVAEKLETAQNEIEELIHKLHKEGRKDGRETKGAEKGTGEISPRKSMAQTSL